MSTKLSKDNSNKHILDMDNVIFADDGPNFLKLAPVCNIETISIVHIRVHQRNGRKCITTVENLEMFNPDITNEKFLDKVAKALRKKLNCSAAVKESDTDSTRVIQLSGDHRDKINKFLIDNNICREDDIKMHGF